MTLPLPSLLDPESDLEDTDIKMALTHLEVAFLFLDKNFEFHNYFTEHTNETQVVRSVCILKCMQLTFTDLPVLEFRHSGGWGGGGGGGGQLLFTFGLYHSMYTGT